MNLAFPPLLTFAILLLPLDSGVKTSQREVCLGCACANSLQRLMKESRLPEVSVGMVHCVLTLCWITYPQCFMSKMTSACVQEQTTVHSLGHVYALLYMSVLCYSNLYPATSYASFGCCSWIARN